MTYTAFLCSAFRLVKAVVGRTVIVVAHRLSTIRQADQIVVMDQHKIVNVGTHQDLLSESEKYQDLIKRQSVMIRDVSINGLSTLLPPDFEDIDEDEENENGVAASGAGTVPEDDDGSEGAMDA